ncbi:hypothetical protein N9L68_04770, partial [bacterium]|nr:hypothetical protein [bacterium]
IVGSRNVLMKRYHMYSDPKGQEEMGQCTRPGAHAYERPMMVMVDETTGNKYMRSVRHRGWGDEGDNSLLIKDVHQELKSWVYQRGSGAVAWGEGDA